MNNDQTDTEQQEQSQQPEDQQPAQQETTSVTEESTQTAEQEQLQQPEEEQPVIGEQPVTVEDTQATAEVKNTEPSASTDELEILLAQMRKEGTQAQKNLIYALDTYVDVMAPGKPMNSETGARYQYTFWKAVQTVIESSPEGEFKRLWSILLAYAEKHKNGVFGDRYLFRFADQWHQSESELTAFQRAMNLVRLTSDPEQRAKGLKQVDLQRSLEETFTEQGRSRLLNFYQ